MAHPKIYCITNIQSEKLEKLSVNLVELEKIVSTPIILNARMEKT